LEYSRILKQIVFLIVALPLLIWLIVNASLVSNPFLSIFFYLLALGYGFFALITGIKVTHNTAGRYLRTYILIGAVAIPFLVIFSLSASQVKYVSLLGPQIPSTAIIAASYTIYEGIFSYVWCPFRKFTNSKCQNCKMTKVCKGCPAGGQKACIDCHIVGTGMLALFLLFAIVIWEFSLTSTYTPLLK